MISPQIESDMSLNIMVLGAEIIKILKKNGRIMITEHLLHRFLEMDTRRRFSMFFETLSFLYTIGFINEENYKIRLKDGITQKTLL